MINVECDKCHVFILEPKENYNVFHVWKNMFASSKTNHKYRHQLCENCYNILYEEIEQFDKELNSLIEIQNKKKILFWNNYCGFQEEQKVK